MRTVGLLLLLVLTPALMPGAPSASRAAEPGWPTWRGPEGTGVTSEKALPEQWSSSAGLAWRAELPGNGVSTPIAAGDHVYVTSQVGSGVRRPGNHPSLVQGAEAGSAGERNLGGSRGGTDTVTFAVTAFRWTDGTRS